MTEVKVIEPGSRIWDDTIEFAKNCSWRAGAYLAQKMTVNDFDEDEHVLVATDNGNIAAFCTYANKAELPPEYGFTPFVGFVFVDEKYRGDRLSEKLINRACGLAREQGFSRIYILSGERGLYEKYGFIKIGDYETIHNSVDRLFYKDVSVIQKNGA